MSHKRRNYVSSTQISEIDFDIIVNEKQAMLFHETVSKTNAQLGLNEPKLLFCFSSDVIDGVHITIETYGGGDTEKKPWSQLVVWCNGKRKLTEIVDLWLANTFEYDIATSNRKHHIEANVSIASKPIVLTYMQELIDQEGFEDFYIKGNKFIVKRMTGDYKPKKEEYQFESLGRLVDDLIIGHMEEFPCDEKMMAFIFDKVAMRIADSLLAKDVQLTDCGNLVLCDEIVATNQKECIGFYGYCVRGNLSHDETEQLWS